MTHILYYISLYRHFIIVCDRVDALSSVLANLEIYREQTKNAKLLGANIIVFPEVDIRYCVEKKVSARIWSNGFK